VTAVLKRFNSQTESSDLSEFSEFKEQSEKNDNVDYNDNNSFQSRDIDLFNLNLKIKAIKIKNDKQIYHNIFSFTNQLCVKAMTMNLVKIQENVELCLLNKTN